MGLLTLPVVKSHISRNSAVSDCTPLPLSIRPVSFQMPNRFFRLMYSSEIQPAGKAHVAIDHGDLAVIPVVEHGVVRNPAGNRGGAKG